MSIAPQLRDLVLRASERLMETAAEEVRLMTAEASPAPHTGDLARSIRVDGLRNEGERFVAMLQATAVHASYTDEGTGEFVGRGRITSNGDWPLKFFWVNGPSGGGIYHFWSVAGQPGQKWWIVHHPDRWAMALAAASGRGAFSV